MMGKVPRLFRVVLAALVAMSVGVSTAPGVSAHEDHDKRHHRITPLHKVDGRTAGQLLADSFAIDYTLPASEHPFGGGDPCVRLGNHGRVTYMGVLGSTCTIHRGDSVLLEGGAACSNVEDPPFFGADEPGQRQCARELNAQITSIRLAVDGRSFNASAPRFLVTAPQRSVVVVADSITGADPGPARFTAEAHAVLVTHLSLGRHRITGRVLFADGTVEHLPPLTVKVVRRQA